MCDSTCDLPLAFLEEKDLHLFPALITLGEKEYRDILDIDTSKIYNTKKRDTSQDSTGRGSRLLP